MAPRRGASLVEVLVVIAILGLMLGLLLGAIQGGRTTAVRLNSQNNLRQIILATHQLADQEAGKIDNLTKTALPKKKLYTESSIHWDLLPWTHGPRVRPRNPTEEELGDYLCPRVKTYISPADPSQGHPVLQVTRGWCSYSCNMMVFDGSFTMPFSLPDGTASTIAFAERYCYSAKTGDYSLYYFIFPASPESHQVNDRRATFADVASGDVIPVKDPVTGQTVASRRGVTFQVRPKVEDADGKQLQTPFPGGLPVAFFDGSVRTIAPGVAEHVFWGLVTPGGGEVVGLD
jgi:hypothetical protein